MQDPHVRLGGANGNEYFCLRSKSKEMLQNTSTGTAIPLIPFDFFQTKRMNERANNEMKSVIMIYNVKMNFIRRIEK